MVEDQSKEVPDYWERKVSLKLGSSAWYSGVSMLQGTCEGVKVGQGEGVPGDWERKVSLGWVSSCSCSCCSAGLNPC